MIGIGSDHGGYELKEKVKKHLEERGLAYKDFGTYSTASCDYPVYGRAVAKAVASGECDRGIIICGHRYRHLHYRKQSEGHKGGAVFRLLLRSGYQRAQ